MASNLSTIGFVFADEDEFRAAMVRYAAEAAALAACETGRYGIWRSRTGAEIWFHFSAADNGATAICGLTPFFDGQSDVEIQITKSIRRDGDNAFEGSFHGWVGADETGEGKYPLVFEAVDFAVHANGPWPKTRRVRLSAFARELTAFADEAAFAAPRADDSEESLNLAPKAFIPVGLFAAAMSNEDGLEATTPSPSALLTGTVLEHRTLQNEATGKSFEWLLVDSLDATFDVIADPDVVSGTIVEGGTVEVMATLFGRFLD